MQREELRLHKELKRLNDERQEFITKACKEQMPDEELAPQMNVLYEKERGVQRRLTTIERTKDDFTQLDKEARVYQNRQTHIKFHSDFTTHTN